MHQFTHVSLGLLSASLILAGASESYAIPLTPSPMPRKKLVAANFSPLVEELPAKPVLKPFSKLKQFSNPNAIAPPANFTPEFLREANQAIAPAQPSEADPTLNQHHFIIQNELRIPIPPASPILAPSSFVLHPSSFTLHPLSVESSNLDPQIIEDSPVLQRWLENIPDVLSEIRNDPSFRTRLRLGYSYFSSNDEASGFNVGIEDGFIGRTGLTISADYQASFDHDQESYGADLRYYVLPLGSYINIAPIIGYRQLTIEEFSTSGINLGVRLLLVFSRTGAADISLTQTWVAPGSDDEIGITTLSLGYAVTDDLRVSTDVQRWGSEDGEEGRLGISLEWML